jgi:hypothetical protein
MAGEAPDDILKFIWLKAAELQRIHGKVGLIFVDVIEDLVAEGVNDIPGSKEIVRQMMNLANRYDCLVGLTLHENYDRGKSDSNQKPTGHLGSTLVKKAETTLKTKKEARGEEEVFSAWTTNARSEGVPAHNAFRFVFSPDDEMHMPAASMHLEYADEQKVAKARKAVRDNPGITQRQLKQEIGGKDSQRKQVIEWLVDRGEIIAEKDGQAIHYRPREEQISVSETDL